MKSLSRCTVALAAAASALATVGAAREARAAGFANTRLGGEQGSVVATNPTSLYYNPAGMAFATGSQLGLYGSLALRHATWTRDPSPNDMQDPGTQTGNTGEAKVFNAFGGPSLAGSLKLGNFVIGGGFFAPFYGRAHWPKNQAFENSATNPLAAGGVQRWFAIDGELTVLYFTAGAAYKLGPVSIGATGNVISTTIDQTQAKVGSGGLPNSNAEGRVFVDAHRWNGSFAAGAMVEVLPDQLWLAASYQAQPGLGTQELKGFQNTTTFAKGTNVAVVQPFPKMIFSQDLPDIIRAGARWRMKSAPLELRLFGDLTRWSKFKNQCLFVDGLGQNGKPATCTIASDGSDLGGGGIQQYVTRNWKDTFGGRLGVSYWVVPAVELLFGAGYETAASPDSTLAPDIPDADNISGTLGARIKLTDSLFLSAEYTHIQYFNRNTTGESTLAVANGAPVSQPTVEEDSGGKYTQWIGILTGNLEALF
jgi:long-chain fatty acid transport protein